MITESANTAIGPAIEHFSEHRFAVIDTAIDPFVFELLSREIETLIEENAMRESTMGKEKIKISQLRGDSIYWHDPENFTIPQRLYSDILQLFKVQLNSSLLLSIDSVESQYAFYPEGSHYSAHRDQLKNDDARLISVVLYLNDHWESSFGGQLILYPEHADSVTIFPKANRMVFFDSKLLHEVNLTKQSRYSVASWFKLRADPLIF